MAGKKVSDFEQMLLKSADQAVAIARGELAPARVTVLDARDVEVAPPPSFTPERVQLLRKNLQLSQPVFADLLNVSVSLVRAWERGAREPEGASQRLLQVAESEGDYIVKQLALLQTPPRAAASEGRRDSSVPRREQASAPREKRHVLTQASALREKRHVITQAKPMTTKGSEFANQRPIAGSHVFTKRAVVRMKKKRG